MWSELDTYERRQLLVLAGAFAVCAALVIAYYVWRDRPAAVKVRVISSRHEVAGCDFVKDVSLPVVLPNPSSTHHVGPDPDLRQAEISLRLMAAAAGGDTVLVTAPGAWLRAKVYSCGR